MPQRLNVDPVAMRRRDALSIPEIPVHAYDQPLSAERDRLGDGALRRILRDMMVIREFETMLGAVKSQGAYRGISYRYSGPAHLSIGQEAAAVGSAFLLGAHDHVFGSHRSHGEFIAKGLSAIATSDVDGLVGMMESHRDGQLLRPLEKRVAAADERERAIQFLLLGLLAEIFGRANGFNRGMGGSMHAFFPPLGIYPNNAIVGASAGIATGAALYKKLRRDGGVAVANIGDGATGCGPVWEAMNFAAMGQLHRLWEEEYRGGLPVIFLFHNNFYAMGGQTIGETSGYDRLARIGAAFNPDNLHAETVDGNNPMAVIDAVRRKRAAIDAGRGPVLLDVECYRWVGHSTTDGNVYRSREELDAWRAMEPLAEYSQALQDAGVLGGADVEQLRAAAAELVTAVVELAVDETVSLRHDVASHPLAVGGLMFCGETRELPAEPVAPLLVPRTDSARLRQLDKRSRSGIGPDGTLLGGRSAVTIRDSLFEAILYHFERDPMLVAYGEENREWGGAFGVYRGLADLLPYHRLFNAPISEAAIVATAVGYAVEGGRALVELMYADFIGRAGDELFNQLGKWQAMSGGLLRMPVVVRTSVGSKYGAQHSQDWTSLVAHIPGLQVAYPVTPYDAKGLIASALSGNDPVVFFESQRLYETSERFAPGGVPREYYRVPIGVPDVKRPGSDVTILTVGPSLYQAIDAAGQLQDRYGVSAEVIDARSLVPFDYQIVFDSVARTRRILLVSEACERGSILATMAQTIQSGAGDVLAAPVQLLGSPNWIVPSAELEETYFPQAADILDLIHDRLLPLAGYTPSGTQRPNRIHLARRGL